MDLTDHVPPPIVYETRPKKGRRKAQSIEWHHMPNGIPEDIRLGPRSDAHLLGVSDEAKGSLSELDCWVQANPGRLPGIYGRAAAMNAQLPASITKFTIGQVLL